MPNRISDDDCYMCRALELARQGRGWTSPNPMSGAVVVKDNVIVGEGFYPAFGKSHAEIFALDAAGGQARGSTLYVISEPCQHNNRQACADRILNAGIERVVVAAADPNPASTGKGIEALKSAGVVVEVGLAGDQARSLNEPYYKFLATRRPFVTWYAVMSCDGKVATTIGERPVAPNECGVELRASNDAVLVGVSTVAQDDPDIVSSLPRSRNPLRVIVDGMARTPPGCRLLAGPTIPGTRPGTLIVTTRFAPDDRLRELKEAGAEILVAPEEAEPLTANVDLRRLMLLLGKREITSLLIEGSGTLADAALASGIVDKVIFFIYPAIIGGTSAPSLVGGIGTSFIEEAQQLRQLAARPCGDGVLLEAYLAGQ
ncbi:MAG: bifunctional diaminohydroxyphosphoribosylaminopyrimidine deaminase/5-amino-6-(5-phosphoribosylamino)uracil reductase RibD [Cyanobacteria bacterium NC_groundwater_1444_Ag_S-0.65um_54_12]|nr:bifunctional diaminohydroxyphosphoribosylaminopyrimidine deaminase/5-amino-6-(5-phosphoribosylamino)uracil reductase RibD [Cyanobacteria bacterium NC_groundwater_1444_Ag_S-0.65um_54_12]